MEGPTTVPVRLRAMVAVGLVATLALGACGGGEESDVTKAVLIEQADLLCADESRAPKMEEIDQLVAAVLRQVYEAIDAQGTPDDGADELAQIKTDLLGLATTIDQGGTVMELTELIERLDDDLKAYGFKTCRLQ